MLVSMFKLFMFLVVIIIMTTCESSEMIDIENETTMDLVIENKEDFEKVKYKNYEFNGVIFYPFFEHIFLNETEEKDDFTYSLKLFAYKMDENIKVVLHSVRIEDQNGIGFKIEEDLKEKELFFEKNDNGLYISKDIINENILISNIREISSTVKDGSQYKVLLNVDVIENGVSSNKKLEFNFKANTRKYLYPNIPGW